MHGASGKRYRVVVVVLSPRLPLLPLLVGKDEQDLGRKTRGVGVRAAWSKAFSCQIAVLVPLAL